MEQQLVDTAAGADFGDLLKRVTLIDREFGHGSPAQAGEVRPDAELLSQFVG